MGVVSLSILGRMTDGIFTDRKDAVDERLIILVMRKRKIHPVNCSNNLVPSFSSRLNRRTFLTVGTTDESIQQHIL